MKGGAEDLVDGPLSPVKAHISAERTTEKIKGVRPIPGRRSRARRPLEPRLCLHPCRQNPGRSEEGLRRPDPARA
jgi:hypothetical protein